MLTEMDGSSPSLFNCSETRCATLDSRSGLGFRENEHEFIPSISRRGINCAAMNSENVCHPAERAASHKMTMGTIDLLQPVQIKQQHRKGSPGASVPLDFRVEDVEKPPVVGKPGERIGHDEMTNLFFGSFALRDDRAQSYRNR